MSALSSHPLNHTFAHFPVKRSNGFTFIFSPTYFQVAHWAYRNKESEGRDRYMRIPFVDYSAAFYTSVLCRLLGKLRNLSPNISTCSWILDLMTNRWWEWLVTLSPRWVGAWEHHRAVSSPHFCTPHTLDDTAVMGLISGGDKLSYRCPLWSSGAWTTNLSPNVQSWTWWGCTPLSIWGERQEIAPKNIKEFCPWGSWKIPLTSTLDLFPI